MDYTWIFAYLNAWIVRMSCQFLLMDSPICKFFVWTCKFLELVWSLQMWTHVCVWVYGEQFGSNCGLLASFCVMKIDLWSLDFPILCHYTANCFWILMYAHNLGLFNHELPLILGLINCGLPLSLMCDGKLDATFLVLMGWFCG